MAIMNIDEILKYLPHRYPFLLVDRVLDYEKDTSIRALKNVSINEPHFTGHFPEFPVMPGVLLIEAMAQVGGILAFMSAPEDQEFLVYFTGIDGVRFRKPVRPGDQVIFELTCLRRRGHMWRFKGDAFVDGDLVCEGTLMATLMPKEKS
ncbi:MAG: 3-hydroxyacyl-[acyl-carrier-protein] dehydratase FabZ [Zetaproteobacteria bacterium CG_4_9_14_3_um_filter_49_83]|nr:MAG: 3-hydroxyacyl-[acyl-carrier-protein] dehydratase FabZ [Zetaproteobacteria bacterium CG17_big_fil_post_rev_8_21_14_2_50_50_13]PIV31227.1 MAG: 3-hydroxyacyl-[acyl-carrier-protein] dehydratase FabZ [Zetaproteobacteria bacterium CG02_land_8_20_14_3_00_50_9]PIY56940.1 MAG: 3-hydroxyacyl-[acyl-carrier-protein] dehydratase FabZ [Zetaproteobacteria bacterium CG_4_10_14_0_8_um_filter_49_80]PJA35337.1 MAG: 3-hydroxyacyl-[acyl-carrier-protein] dehydratase FabZ [Zetaproteobacteria bacterium CG_4_9_1